MIENAAILNKSNSFQTVAYQFYDQLCKNEIIITDLALK